MHIIPIHLGYAPPSHYDDAEAWARMDSLGTGGTVAPRGVHRPEVCKADFDWSAYGFEPRWSGEDTSVCVAAINPGEHTSGGGDDLERLMSAARGRDETVLMVCAIESYAGHRFRGRYTTLPVRINGIEVACARLPDGTLCRVADGLDDAERDLGVRLAQVESPLWAISFDLDPDGGEEERVTSFDESVGRWKPILVTDAGEVVAGVFDEPVDSVGWFIIPTLITDQVLRWLLDRALPAYVPEALARSRRAHLVDPSLRTAAETESLDELARLTNDYTRRRDALAERLGTAEAEAVSVRDPLLYASGSDLERAVARVLGDAGFDVEDLDAIHGTATADLLASRDGRHWLIEVKSSRGPAGEDLADKLVKHGRTFATFDSRPVAGLVLVVNHEASKPPADRSPVPFSRKVFVDTLPMKVLSTRQLFDWWRVRDFGSIVDAIESAPPPQIAAVEA